jgi:tetratricopeptide (TPR) repeat protein
MAKKQNTENLPEGLSQNSSETQPMKKSRSIFKSEVDQSVEHAEPEAAPEDLQVIEPEPVKNKHGLWVWIGILVMLVIAAIGTGIGYKMAMDVRQREELSQRLVIATTQFELALRDEKNGNLDLARKRLEYILDIYPAYPGLDEKLKDVMLAIALTKGPSQLTTPVPNETPMDSVTIVPTTDTKNLRVLLNQAQTQLTAKDWSGLLTTVLTIRNLDPFYEPVKVDGLYYMALRNNGISKVKEGSLEVGIYYFTLAEQIAPIDTDAESYRIWARMYDNAGSYWQINMQQAAALFSELYPLVPNLVDSSGISVRSRYAAALEGYGDYLQQTFMWCEAVPQYEASMGVVSSSTLSEN